MEYSDRSNIRIRPFTACNSGASQHIIFRDDVSDQPCTESGKGGGTAAEPGARCSFSETESEQEQPYFSETGSEQEQRGGEAGSAKFEA